MVNFKKRKIFRCENGRNIRNMIVAQNDEAKKPKVRQNSNIGETPINNVALQNIVTSLHLCGYLN